MNPTQDQLIAVLAAAERVLAARVDGMLTAEEWSALAGAVAACTGREPGELLTDWDLDQRACAASVARTLPMQDE